MHERSAGRRSMPRVGQHGQYAECVGNGTFVTLLTGERYAAPAACLPAQLRAVNSTCPLLLVYNDADPSLPLPLLEEAYGREWLMPLSHLKVRHERHGRARLIGGAPGRRLFAGAEAHNTYLKIWLWALSLPGRAVFLDIDILLLRNVDGLLEIMGNVSKDAKDFGAITCKSKFGERYFNSGIMVFTPSMHVLDRLLEYVRFASGPWYGHLPHASEPWVDKCSPRDDPYASKRMFPNSSNALSECRARYGPGRTPGKMVKACESKYTDQSIFNMVFTSHVSLPRGYNMASASHDVQTHYIQHFVGEPKPWSNSAFTGRGSEPARRLTTRLWRQRCARTFVDHGKLPVNHTWATGP